MTLAIALHDGTSIPQLGFGTLNIISSRDPDAAQTREAADIVSAALEAGYRHLDTAQMYGNEKAVGDAIKSCGLGREELYVTTKLSNAAHLPDDVAPAFAESLDKLGLEYIDLFLMHWPLPTLYDGDYVSTWRAMAALLEGGQVRSIGVSNFQPAHLDRIITETGVVPVVNQVEVHPYFANNAVRDASRAHQIAIEAWSPLGQGRLLDDPAIGRVARELGRSTAQVMLRWHVQHGHIVFPKSTNPQRMAQNMDIFNFELTSTQMDSLDALDRGEEGRNGPNPDSFGWVPSTENPTPR